MTARQIVIRIVIGLAVLFWSFNVLAVAVFAIPDKNSGAQAVFLSSVVMVVGHAPIAFFMYLFRERRHAVVIDASHASLPAGKPGSADAPVAPLVEPISERELEVLALLARGHSNKEIALELSVTVGTVKTHTNNINRKLGTRNRMQAIARARALELI